MGIERQYVGDVLIRPHHDHAAFRAIDAARIENIGTVLQVRTERLFVIDQFEASLARPQQRRQCIEREIAMALLKHRAHVDHRIDIGFRGRVNS